MNDLISTLHESGASLVVSSRGELRTFFKKGVRDLEDLLDHDPDFLKGAVVADKVVGKASAGMMAFGGVVKVYAETLSRLAIPEGDDRCPLEKIVSSAKTPGEVVSSLREHFAQMRSAHS